MFKAEIRIEHDGCWGSDVSLRFPHHDFTSVDCRWVGGQVAHLVKVQGEPSAFKDVARYFRRRRDVSQTAELSHDADTMYLRVLTRRLKNVGQFSDAFFKNHCFTVSPTGFVGREEIWTLGSANKKNLAVVIKILRGKYPVRIRYLKEEAMREPLSPRQREALMLAAHMGYYDWPRTKTATELAKMARTSKTAFLSALRNAERKVMREYARQRQ